MSNERNIPIRLNYCIYCECDYDLTRDHVIPSAFTHLKRTFTNVYHVTACRECNSTLSDSMCITVCERAAFLLKRYKVKYSEELKQPNWTEDELKEMSPQFERVIRSRCAVSKDIFKRVERLKRVAVLGEAHLDFDQRTIDDVDVEYEKALAKYRAVREQKRVEVEALPVVEPPLTEAQKEQIRKKIERCEEQLTKWREKHPTNTALYNISFYEQQISDLIRKLI